MTTKKLNLMTLVTGVTLVNTLNTKKQWSA